MSIYCDLELYKNCPIKNYADQVNFTNRSAQMSAFDKLTKHTFKNLSSVDLTKKTIRLNINYYVGNQYNYGCLSYDGDKYYIFIQGVEWLSNQTVVLHFEYDYWQTYQFNIVKNKCMIEREHVSDDTFGKHIIDEGLATFGIKSKTYYRYNPQATYIGVALADTSGFIDGSTNEQIPVNIKTNGHYSTAIIVTYNEQKDMFSELIAQLVDDNKIDSIVGCFSFPVYDTSNQGVPWLGACTYNGKIYPYLKNNIDFTPLTKTIDRPVDFGLFETYTPKNNKCFTEPYNYVEVSNNNGDTLKLAFELSKEPDKPLEFKLKTVIGQGCSPYMYCKSYQNYMQTLVNAIMNPEVGWITNTYSAYLSANANTLATEKHLMGTDALMGQLSNLYGGAISVAKKDISGVINSGMSAIQTEYQYQSKLERFNASLNDIKSKGDTLHGSFSSCACMDEDFWGWNVYIKQVSNECIKMVDSYFDMNGYKVNRVGTPQWTSRKNWNFIKTVNSNITGNIPTDAIVVINNMFDSGVTMWHNLSNMYNYDLDNSIV